MGLSRRARGRARAAHWPKALHSAAGGRSGGSGREACDLREGWRRWRVSLRAPRGAGRDRPAAVGRDPGCVANRLICNVSVTETHVYLRV